MRCIPVEHLGNLAETLVFDVPPEFRQPSLMPVCALWTDRPLTLRYAVMNGPISHGQTVPW